MNIFGNDCSVNACPVLTRGYPLEIHHAECEVNFLRLARLLPEFSAGASRRIGIRFASGHEDTIELRVTERSPYTAVIELRQARPVWGYAALEITIRAYLDARMAEVTACRQSRRLLPRYPYPNSRGLARDEKWQQDLLLGEWLSRCLADGHQADFAPAGDVR